MTAFKSFWNNYSSNIVKFWTNQIVMSLLGISVGLATIALDNFVIAFIGCVFTIGLLCFLQYDNLFQLGEKHHFMHADTVRPSKCLGFKIALLGSVPLFLLVLLGFLMEVVFRFANGSTVCNFIYYGIHGTYIQTHAFISSLPLFDDSALVEGLLRWSFCAIYILPAILLSGLGYYLGSKDVTLRSVFGIKSAPKHH